MNNIESSNYECAHCHTEGGHCYGDDNNCTCSCRITKARQMVTEYLLRDVSRIKNEYQTEFKQNPNGFIENILNEFYVKQEFPNNKKMYEELFSFLENYTNGDNLNTRESRPRLS